MLLLGQIAAKYRLRTVEKAVRQLAAVPLCGVLALEMLPGNVLSELTHESSAVEGNLVYGDFLGTLLMQLLG